MTTLVTLQTKDAVVMGCDSLASTTKLLIDPFELLKFFDSKKNYEIKTSNDGKPLLNNFDTIYRKSQQIPFNHMPHVTKLFSLEPLEMGLMITGISSIGNRTIKSLINEFKTEDKAFKKGATNYTVKTVAERLKTFIDGFYQGEYKTTYKPPLELMIGGYSKQKQLSSVYRILIHENNIEFTFKGEFGVSFGGQYQEIQRIVFGTDTLNSLKIIDRFENLINKYKGIAESYLKQKGINENLPVVDDKLKKQLNFFDQWGLDGFDAPWGELSDQNAIECVSFFVEIMINCQQFSARMPTVGGDVHISLINKQEGFKFVSREEYVHEGYSTPKEGASWKIQ